MSQDTGAGSRSRGLARAFRSSRRVRDNGIRWVGLGDMALGKPVIAEHNVIVRGHGRLHQPGDGVEERRPRMERRHHANRNRCQCFHLLDRGRSRGCRVLRIHGDQQDFIHGAEGSDAVGEAGFAVPHADPNLEAGEIAEALSQRHRVVNEGRAGCVIAPDGPVRLGALSRPPRKNEGGHDHAPYRPRNVQDVGVHQELVQVAAHGGGVAAGRRSEISDQDTAYVHGGYRARVSRIVPRLRATDNLLPSPPTRLPLHRPPPTIARLWRAPRRDSGWHRWNLKPGRINFDVAGT